MTKSFLHASLWAGLSLSGLFTAWATEPSPASHETRSLSPTLPQFYRDLSSKIRTQGHFKIPMPSHGDLEFSYQLRLGTPLFEHPIVKDYTTGNEDGLPVRAFYDKIFLEAGSYLELSGEQIPLTCIFIRGQDNRLAKDSPLFPDIFLRIYLVANDFSCTGPINPGWPENGAKKEMWDTYLRFDVKDPTIMLPVETILRYRWNEHSAVLIDSGQGGTH